MCTGMMDTIPWQGYDAEREVCCKTRPRTYMEVARCHLSGRADTIPDIQPDVLGLPQGRPLIDGLTPLFDRFLTDSIRRQWSPTSSCIPISEMRDFGSMLTQDTI